MKLNKSITLAPLTPDDREQFIIDNQEAFRFGTLEEFGLRNNHTEEDGEIISRETIEKSIDGENSETLRILEDGKPVGGVVLKLDPITQHNELELLFVAPKAHSKGVGFTAWQLIEQRHPETVVWKTLTLYVEKCNIHFYINKCGFRVVEFFGAKHPAPYDRDGEYSEGPDEMFRFEKCMK